MDQFTHPQPISEQTDSSPGKARNVVIGALAIIVIAALALFIYLQNKKQAEEAIRTPEETMQALEDSSAPSVRSTEDRAKQLDALEKSSTPANNNVDERLKDFDVLQ